MRKITIQIENRMILNDNFKMRLHIFLYNGTGLGRTKQITPNNQKQSRNSRK